MDVYALGSVEDYFDEAVKGFVFEQCLSTSAAGGYGVGLKTGIVGGGH